MSVTYRTTFETGPTFKNTIVRLGRRRAARPRDRGGQATCRSSPARDRPRHRRRQRRRQVDAACARSPASCRRASGRIEVHGRVSTLLALGVGFNATLTGQENVVLGGLAAGLSREQIVARSTRRSRSSPSSATSWTCRCAPTPSGMYGRLAFSVACNMDPDILLVDEALSAGDARFREKSIDRMQELSRRRGRSCSSATPSERSSRSATTRSGCTRAASRCGTTRRPSSTRTRSSPPQREGSDDDV